MDGGGVDTIVGAGITGAVTGAPCMTCTGMDGVDGRCGVRGDAKFRGLEIILTHVDSVICQLPQKGVEVGVWQMLCRAKIWLPTYPAGHAWVCVSTRVWQGGDALTMREGAMGGGEGVTGMVLTWGAPGRWQVESL